MNSTAIYSKTGKGVQEASGKTSQLPRGDRAILSAIDGKITLKDLSAKFDRALDEKFFALIRTMDQDGFIREVSPGVAQRGAANAPRPAPSAPSKPSAPAAGGGGELDFTQIFSVPPKMEKPPADPMAVARHEAEMRQRAEREAKARAAAQAKALSDAAHKERLDAEARAKAAREASMHAAAEGKTKAEIEARTRAEAGRASREAEDLRRKVEDERRAREEAERRAREEAERTRREAEERARHEAEEKKTRQEAEELHQKLEKERKAREEAEHRAREEREKRERERALEEAERRAREEVERKEREERDRREQEENQRQIRLAREAEDKKRRDADARKRKEADGRRWEQEDARRKSDNTYRVRAEQEDKERAEREAVEAVERAEAEKKAAEAADALSGSLMMDLDSFSKREEEERKEKEEQERQKRAEAQRRAQEEEAQREREEAERRARKEEDKRRRQEEERKAKEEEERQAREAEEKYKEQEAERKKRKEREAAARKGAEADIPISPSDMGRDEVADDERKLTPEARKALRDREREVARARSRGDQPSAKAATAYKRKQPVKWGKPVALALFFLLVGGVGVLNFLPLSTAEYERLATDALGAPVKIGSARMWVLAGVQMRFERVSIGESIRIAEVRAVPEFGSLLNNSKAFSRVEVDKVTLQQEALGGALFGAMKDDRLRVARVVAKELKLEGPLALPVLDADAAIGSDGRVASVRLSGERISGLITPKGDGVTFEMTLGSFTLPFLDKISLVDFGMKGSANRQGMTLSEFDGRLYDGTMVGKGRIQWGAQWSVQGEIQGRAMNAAVFSPQMVSEGRFDGKGRFAMAGPDPAKLTDGARLDGAFTVTKGALGSFDLSRALQSTSAQASGRTRFSELAGSAALANGALALRDLKLTSGLLTANGTLDVDAAGGLSGRVNAELRNLRGTFYIGGKLQEPQLRR